MNKFASDAYKKKLGFFVLSEQQALENDPNEAFSGLRQVQNKIAVKLRTAGVRDKISALEHSNLGKWTRGDIAMQLKPKVIRWIAIYKDTSFEAVKEWLENDDTPIDSPPWCVESSDYSPSAALATQSHTSNGAGHRSKSQRSVIDLRETVESASDKDLISAAPEFFGRLFSGAQVFVAIVPQGQTPDEMLERLSNMRFFVSGQSGENEREQPEVPHPGSGQLAEYVRQLLAAHGRDLDDRFDFGGLISKVEIALTSVEGDETKKQQAIVAITSALHEETAAIAEEDEEIALTALSSGLNALLKTQATTMDYLSEVNAGKAQIQSQATSNKNRSHNF
jgi:hypothetical protein